MHGTLIGAVLAAALLPLLPPPSPPPHGPPPASGPPAREPVLGWPLSPRPAVERFWDPPVRPWDPGHRGADLRAPGPGALVRAAADGRVAFAGPVAGRGVLVISLPGTGLRLTHEPVRAAVAVGEAVTRGQPVGTLEQGPYHCARPCLHWGLLRGEDYLDPLARISPGPPRLLPLPRRVSAPARRRRDREGPPGRGRGTPLRVLRHRARAAPREPRSGAVPAGRRTPDAATRGLARAGPIDRRCRAPRGVPAPRCGGPPARGRRCRGSRA